jgi:hypothetical protein
MSTLFLDLEEGNDAADGLSFANRVRSFGRASELSAPGDTIRVKASLDAQNLGTNVTWVDGQSFCTCTIPQVEVVNTKNAWTVSTNVTQVASNSRKSGSSSVQIQIGTAFTTGKAAYLPLGSTVDFSTYQQLSLMMQFTGGTLAANIDICLCSDTVGATPVDTLTIPAAPSAGSNWLSVVLNKGSALGASIQSIAIYVNSDQGAQTINIDNIVACKAAGSAGELNHRTLIGKPNSPGCGGTDTELWYPIRSFGSGGRVFFDTNSQGLSVQEPNVPSYRGTTETVSGRTQKLWTGFNTNISVAGQADEIYFQGTPSSRIVVSGGWDRTAMTTQTGYTWLSFAGYVSGTMWGQSVSCHVDMSRIYWGQRLSNNLSHWINWTIDTLVICSTMQTSLESSTVGKVLAYGSGVIQGIKCTFGQIIAVNTNGQKTVAISNNGGSLTVDEVNNLATNLLTSYSFSDGRKYTSPWVTESAKEASVQNLLGML